MGSMVVPIVVMGRRMRNRRRETMTDKKPKKSNLGKKLRARGFDLTRYDRSTGYYSPRCSQCEALVINGTACHERGCPNGRT